MALTQVAGGMLAGSITSSQISSVAGSTITGSQSIPKNTLPTGSVLQVVQATTTSQTSTTSGSFTDTNLSATITPSSSSSKILVLVTQCMYADSGGSDNGGATQIVRNSTGIFGSANSNSFYILASSVAATGMVMYVSMNYLDSPATTSATTYKTQMKAENSSNIVAQVNSNASSIQLLEISA